MGLVGLHQRDVFLVDLARVNASTYQGKLNASTY